MKIYKNMNPEEKRKFENAMIRIASLAGIVAFFLLLKIFNV